MMDREPLEVSSKSAAVVTFETVTKRFGDVVAVRELELEIMSGEFISLLGPSGCGKTTTLRMIAGFDQPSEGEVRLGGRRVNGVPAHERPVNMVFQHYALFPHMNVEDNVAYGLRQRSPRPSRAQVRNRVGELLDLVRLSGFEARRIWEMSGGQQQRVALARALINEPDLLLLDEPLAALDRKLRREMQIELQNLQRRVGITFVLVTHDQEEALSMSDRICIMRDGRIVQIGTPQELYDRPAGRWVADFVGKSNFFDGALVSMSGETVRITLSGGLEVLAHIEHLSPDLCSGADVCLSVRPEQMVLARDVTDLPRDAALTVEAVVRNRIFLGEHTEYLLHADRLGEFLALAPRQSQIGERPFDVGETAQVAWDRRAALVLGRE